MYFKKRISLNINKFKISPDQEIILAKHIRRAGSENIGYSTPYLHKDTFFLIVPDI